MVRIQQDEQDYEVSGLKHDFILIILKYPVNPVQFLPIIRRPEQARRDGNVG
jgi:hypothetical protein